MLRELKKGSFEKESVIPSFQFVSVGRRQLLPQLLERHLSFGEVEGLFFSEVYIDKRQASFSNPG